MNQLFTHLERGVGILAVMSLIFGGVALCLIDERRKRATGYRIQQTALVLFGMFGFAAILLGFGTAIWWAVFIP